MNTKVAAKASCLLLVFIFGVNFIAADKEFDVVPKLYEEIGCTEIKSDSGTKSFKCPDFSKYDINKCYLSGNTFNIDDAVQGDFVPSCRADCKCKKFGATAEIVCANVECPDLFEEYNPKCISIYDNLNHCCRSSKICDQEKIRSLKTCEVDGRTYRHGERIYPENACYTCHCVDGYNNVTSHADNPNCSKVNCGMELQMNNLREGCVPVYYKTPNCCAIDHKCPSNDDVIESQSKPSHGGQSCKFGRLNLNVGDKLKSKNKCLSCKCSIPPFITCINTC